MKKCHRLHPPGFHSPGEILNILVRNSASQDAFLVVVPLVFSRFVNYSISATLMSTEYLDKSFSSVWLVRGGVERNSVLNEDSKTVNCEMGISTPRWLSAFLQRLMSLSSSSPSE